MEFTYKLKRSTTNKKENQIISSNDRLYYHQKANLTKYLRMLSGKESVNLLYDEHKPCEVSIIIRPPTKRKMDGPNLYPTIKALLDGLTDAGLWTDDNDNIIKRLSFEKGEVTNDGLYHITIRTKLYKEADQF